MHASKVFTFKVRDVKPRARRYPPFIDLTSRPPRQRVLRDDISCYGLYGEVNAVRGHPGLYTYRPTPVNFSGYWLVTPGKYYVQIQQVGCSVHTCERYSPVETITVR